MNKHFNEVSNFLEQLGRTRDLSQVFNDLLTMSICSFHQTNLQSQLTKNDEGNEKLYKDVIKKYQSEELGSFARVLSHLQLNVLDNPYSDILGEFFMLNITRGQNGQFFTPEPVCEMMAKIQGAHENGTKNRVLDPACGSGRMLLAYAKLNPDNYFFGADNSEICAKMATLNFFLNGLRGEVAWMDSLRMEWFGGWRVNVQGLGILPIDKEQSTIWSTPPTKKPQTPQNSGSQLNLF